MRLSAELEAPPRGWGRCGEVQGISRPFGDIGHVGYREGTSPEICGSGFETQGGYSKLLDAHPEFNPNGRYAADCVLLDV